MKKGIELEFFTVDSSGELCGSKPVERELEFADPEFAKCIIEVKSEPHDSIDQLKKDITQKVIEVVKVGRKHDIRIVPLGTPLNHDDIELIENERLELMQKFNAEDIKIEKELARLGFHIHFEKQNVKNQLNILTGLEPIFCLVNSSPYHKGKKIASSSRNAVYRYSWEPKLPESVYLWEYADSVQEWKDRMRESFQKFKNEALSYGVSEERFNQFYHPDRSVWTPIRLRDEFPTVEFRSPDTTLISEAIKLVEDLDRILTDYQDERVVIGEGCGTNEKEIKLPTFEKVERLSKLAAQEGIKSSEVEDYLEKFGIDSSRYNPLTDKFGKKETITIEESAELRLKAADLLEKDLGLQ